MALATTAWSFGKAQRSSIVNHKGKKPGPGQYELAGKGLVTAAQPSFSMGKSTRSGPVKATVKVPGPGSYEFSSAPKGGKVVMGKKLGSCLDTGKRRAPGPGHYDAQPTRTSIQGGRMGQKLTVGSGLDGPRGGSNLGPGSYTVASDFDKQQYQSAKRSESTRNQSTFGSSRKTLKSKLQVPGPGNYTIEPKMRQSYSYSFGSSKRPELGAPKGGVQAPGPGQYNGSMFQSQISCSMKHRYESSLVDKKKVAPGPGQYNPDYSGARPATAGQKFGSSKRTNIGASRQSAEWPGPGQFLTIENQEKGKGYSFGTSNRSQIGGGKGKEAPGPGNYTSKLDITRIDGPKYSILGGRIEPADRELPMSNEPGPGQYNSTIDVVRESYGSVKIGKGERSNLSRDNKWLPGPGNYEVNYAGGGKSFGFGTGKRQEIGKKADRNLEVPGPGYYSIPVSFDGLKSYQKPPETQY